MSLREIIQQDLNEAVKKENELKRSVLRMVLAAIISKEKEKRYKVATKETGIAEEDLVKKSRLSEEELIGLVFSEAKKRKESIVEFEKGKRQDLVEKETKELEILKKYLPEPISEKEIAKMAQEVISRIGASSQKDMGRVLGELMPKFKGKAEGGVVSKIVKDLLIKT